MFCTPVGIWYIYDIIDQHLGKNERDGNGDDLTDKQMFYGNMHTAMKALVEKLETFLDTKEDLNKYDVLVIHGYQSKEERLSFLKNFSTCTGQNMNFKIVCATSGVSNAGIDCKDLQFVFDLIFLHQFGTLRRRWGVLQEARQQPASITLNSFSFN